MNSIFIFAILIFPYYLSAASPEFLALLYKVSNGLLTTQITTVADPNYGALLCPSTNPENHPTHSRSGEAVYPLAIAYKYSKDVRYSQAAVKLGNWMISIQNPAGYWGEDTPNHDGWNGTTADQVISLAGAYAILKPTLTPTEDAKWKTSLLKSSNWIAATFPIGNINYLPTGAVALKMTYDALPGSPLSWLTKATSLMDTTVNSITSEGFLEGEGGGVDLGYNIAQSIGYITLYGILTANKLYVDKGTALLKVHFRFMYPNGSIDNSWGTRSYKWMLESGSKTAPGIPFTFAMQADKDPQFNRAAQLSLNFLGGHFLDTNHRVIYGPHAFKHPGSNPACIYPSFARAQSLALAVEYGPTATLSSPIPSETANWFLSYPKVKTGLIRTQKIMATLSAYDAISKYSRGTVTRGGSITNLWFEGYGDLGFLQTSSQTIYLREEARHMPIETDLLPLTARIETKVGASDYSNLLDDKATLSLAAVPGNTGAFTASANGSLCKADGVSSGTAFSMNYRFDGASYTKEITVSANQGVQMVEPFVDLPGNQYSLINDSTFTISIKEGGVWQLHVVSSSVPFTLTAGENRIRYWSPFPGLECYPLTIKLAKSTGSQTIKYTISRKSENTVSILTRPVVPAQRKEISLQSKAFAGGKWNGRLIQFSKPKTLGSDRVPATTVQGRNFHQVSRP
jgi:hypothetical protein